MLTLSAAAEKLRARRLSPVELTEECLRAIEKLNPRLNAFVTVTADLAIEQACRAEVEIAAGNYRGPLHGIPIGLKDLFDTAGVRTTAASNQYRDRVPAQDAEVVRRLKEAGAVIVGKLNMHEFAFGMTGMVSAFGPTRNPWNTDCITGGSSSGSAAAVAAGLCIAALGSDTAGSNRAPQALCGVVGHRPTANLISLDGVVPLAPSFDTVGPAARTVEDAALLMDVLADGSLCSQVEQDVSHLRVAIARAHFFDSLQPNVASGVEDALSVVQTLTAEARDVTIPVDGFRTIFNAEIYEFHEQMANDTPELYDPRTLLRVRACAKISAPDYIREQHRLAQFRVDAEKIFSDVDVVITPTVPIPAPRIADLEALPINEARAFEVKYLMRNTAPFSSLFWPTISVPCGFTSGGLPVGMQISARPGADGIVFSLAHKYQQATSWHKRRPDPILSKQAP